MSRRDRRRAQQAQPKPKPDPAPTDYLTQIDETGKPTLMPWWAKGTLPPSSYQPRRVADLDAFIAQAGAP